ncbi:desmoglein-1-alpha preproprotein [Mus musculus]|uniref:Desmoglein-1-alpha n=1 Tax=Mus musculus TaxID=10090 RepID=DSG1A_MOUSE|nr:desmoglein-1-alpha preproprotein [Mus musculus]Q61495.2 RecName: Full=Desmoglein-1-alpha; Short=Desmoglein-1; Short=Dsg1-alpha; AltName: Full=DG1; AltName: Full=DGI; AltName: Full=Desmosomal glycoprotein I; Flags: Precursor [Mus musculus]AAI54411.1 Desmoglein 1 alpha [Mus musculus]EDK96946.1 mCG140885 [Mus musculus]|eukprot:NP_034209.2 desmoglein-1-alpha preproprotein [Mus musculus]
MDWHSFRIAALLLTSLVVLEVNSEFQIQVRDHNAKNGTIKWHSIRRQKREWIKFAAACREGEDNSKRNPIAKIHSDCAANQPVTYRISGVGIDQPPYGIFIINQKTGEINITSIVDREVTPFFIIYCRALNAQGQDLENPLELRVRVMDINDNPPVFSMTTFLGQIEENSNANTLVMKLNATDADEPNNLNSMIAFKIIRQEPSDSPMFIINRKTGEIRTMNNFLDREQYSQYSLVVRGSDRDGGADGMSAESECSITILDVNDNIPYLEQSSYDITIEENALHSQLVQIRVIDLDEEFSDNWKAIIFFISGNEGNWFEIEMNERTNVGTLKVVKPLDYEAMKNLQLSIGVRNVAEFHQSIISQYRLTATMVTVTVLNVIEGSVFRPGSKTFVVDSRMEANHRVGEFVATDLDTGRASTNVRYEMGNNPENLLVVDSRTGIITLRNRVTMEQYQRLNGEYKGTVLSIDDSLQRTCTGTIVIELSGTGWVTGSESGGSSSGSGDDRDRVTNGYQGTSSTENPQRVTGSWGGSGIDGTRPNTNPFQGDPDETLETPLYGDNVHFGPAGIGLLIMGFLVLGLVPFLLICCDCGGAPGGGAGFEPVPECSDGAIHTWAVEGPQPEPHEGITTICVPQMPPGNANVIEYIDNSGVYTNEYCGREMQDLGGGERTTGFELMDGVKTSAAPEICQEYSGTLRRNSMRECRDGGLNMNFMESYFCQKAYAYADEDEGRPSNDCLLIYDIEGVGSPAGSVGCCSFIGEDLDESFLDTLGPKFKKLADISLGKEIDSYPDSDPSWPPQSTEPMCPQHTEPLGSGHPPISPHFGTTTVISENAYHSGPGVQHPVPIPDPLGYGNVTVRESYTTSGTLKPSVHFHDNQQASNVVVTERVVGPISGADLHGMLEIPDLRGGANVIVTERVIAPGSSLPTSLTIPNPQETSNVVVTERVIQPTSGMIGNLSMTPELSSAHNVIVTERVVSGAGMSEIAGTAGLGGVGGIGSSGLVSTTMGASGTGLNMGGTATIGHMRSSSDHHFSQTVGSASPSMARSRITKYNTVQYSK